MTCVRHSSIAQVLTNIVETFHNNIVQNLNRTRFNIQLFVNQIQQVMSTVKSTNVGNFVCRPDIINPLEYHPSMRHKGTNLHSTAGLVEVTTRVQQLTGHREGRFFLCRNHRFSRDEGVGDDRDSGMEAFLRAVLLSQFGEGVRDSSLEDIVGHLYRYHLVTLNPYEDEPIPVVNQPRDVRCTCKTYRDWGRCGHCYAAELQCGSQTPYFPAPLRRVRRGRQTRRRQPTLRRYGTDVAAHNISSGPNVEARPSNYDSDGYSNDGGSIATTVALSAREDNDIEVGDLPGSMPVGDLEIEDLPDLAADNNSQYSEDADSLTATEVDIQNSEELGDDDNGHSNMQSDISPPSESEISIENLPDFRPHRELSDNLETTEAFNCAVTVTSSSSELSIEDL